jgi:mRNA interferase MazF
MNRREIWLVNLDPTMGDEIKKSRPCIIVNDDDIGRLALRVIVPITGWQDAFAEFPWMVRLDPDESNGLSKTSTADTFQIRSVSTARFVRKTGSISVQAMEKIADALVVMLGLEI